MESRVLAGYYKVVAACDRLLRRPEATLEWVAVPWLHVINQHPVQIAKYADSIGVATGAPAARPGPGARALDYLYEKAYKTATFGRNFIRAIPVSLARNSLVGAMSGIVGHVDVVLVSWLVSTDHIDSEADFYFGNTQKLLADQGLASLLLLRNQTGRSAVDLAPKIKRQGERARLLLPEASGLGAEIGFLRRCFQARRRLRGVERAAASPLDSRVARTAGEMVVSHAVAANLRLQSQLAYICRQTKPSVVLALYEGHAWERCVFNGARAADPKILCGGYQHTIIQKDAHALKRAVGPGKVYDPDIILTVGDITKEMLEACQAGHKATVITFGTHRRNSGGKKVETPSTGADILVLPEGIESECIYLFNFAAACARRLPDVRFIWRTHPVLPFDKIKSDLEGAVPENVEISRESSINADFSRSGYLLYRGSSTVIYAILAGLRPYYISGSDGIDIDPIYELKEWRRSAASVDELLAAYTEDKAVAPDEKSKTWRLARDFCDRYIEPERPAALKEMMEISNRRTSVLYG